MCRTLIYYRCICRFNQYSRHGYQRTTTHEKCYFARRSIVFRHNISYQNVEDLVREYLSKKWEKYSSIKMIAKHHLSLIRQNNLPSLESQTTGRVHLFLPSARLPSPLQTSIKRNSINAQTTSKFKHHLPYPN